MNDSTNEQKIKATLEHAAAALCDTGILGVSIIALSPCDSEEAEYQGSGVIRANLSGDAHDYLTDTMMETLANYALSQQQGNPATAFSQTLTALLQQTDNLARDRNGMEGEELDRFRDSMTHIVLATITPKLPALIRDTVLSYLVEDARSRLTEQGGPHADFMREMLDVVNSRVLSSRDETQR